jgi:Asp-tRNA(Asn)/Glu-tRNA(Gln) amidotransferase A subunit family amidase
VNDAERTVGDALERLAARPDLNAVITLCADEAMARARAGVEGRLAGVPLLVKDLIDTAGVRTTYASAIYRDHVPTETAPAARPSSARRTPTSSPGASAART